MQITVYTTLTCPYCQLLKAYLKQNNLVFTEKLVDQDVAAKEEMLKASDGYLGVPFSLITKDDGQIVKVVGFDKKLMDQTLGLVQ